MKVMDLSLVTFQYALSKFLPGQVCSEQGCPLQRCQGLLLSQLAVRKRPVVPEQA